MVMHEWLINCMFRVSVHKMIVIIFKRKTAYEKRISDWSSYLCSSGLLQQFDLLALLASAKDDPQRGGFLRLAFVLGQPAKIKLHLSLESRLELADLQLYCH